ncbi:hypothetical protein [Streptomyces sp. NBC_01244]|uniref:hypothetical protein n=1 Tax=Streptomyces sp. NBC_01244 TaxID=2903797 RepID=UPI002E119753|nr:hypothetical protein OG247_29325 [Streptomyces sp. NBC_01244]
MLDAGDGWTALAPGLVVTGAGVGLVSPALAAAAMGAVPPARAGMAGGGAARLLETVPGAGSWVEAAFASGLRDAFRVSGAMGLAGALILLVLVLVRRPAAGSGGGAPAPVPGQGSAPADRAAGRAAA